MGDEFSYIPSWGASGSLYQKSQPSIAMPTMGEHWGTPVTNTGAMETPAFGGMIGPEGSGSSSSGFNWFGGKSADGTTSPNYVGMGLGLAQGFGNMYMGMKQYGLAKDALKTSKEQFARNYEAQRTITNAGLEDRQRARVASNPGAYQSVGAYMNQNKVA